MELLKKSDKDILAVAELIRATIVTGNNNKDWAEFSKYMSPEEQSDPDIKADVERQWEESEWLTSLHESAEYLGVIRKDAEVMVLWKQKSHKTNEELLQKLTLIEVDGEIVQDAIWME